jgi:hypothetical protein
MGCSGAKDMDSRSPAGAGVGNDSAENCQSNSARLPSPFLPKQIHGAQALDSRHLRDVIAGIDMMHIAGDAA